MKLTERLGLRASTGCIPLSEQKIAYPDMFYLSRYVLSIQICFIYSIPSVKLSHKLYKIMNLLSTTFCVFLFFEKQDRIYAYLLHIRYIQSLLLVLLDKMTPDQVIDN